MSPRKEHYVVQLDRKTISQRKKAAKAVLKLTPSERAVYDLLVQGLSAQQIAERLGNSPFTISNHTRKIFAAFGVNSRSAIIAMLVVPL